MNILNNKSLREQLAASYVLGTLRGATRRRFETLLANSAQLDADVQSWQQRLNPLAEFAQPQTPPQRVWQQLERSLNLSAISQSSGQSFWRNINDNIAGSLNFWRGLGLVSSTAAAVLALLLLMKPADNGMPTPSLVAMLVNDKAQPNLMLVADIKHHRLTAKILASQNVASNQSLELWAIPKQGAPKSLGLLAKDGSISLPLPEFATTQDIAMLAVSLEPLHGSADPNGPSGPVLFTGAWQQI